MEWANYPDSVVGIMRTEQEFIDGVYRVEHVTTAQAGIVTVTCNFNSNDASVAGESIQVYRRGADVSGVNTNGFYGHYSWGKIYDFRNRVLGKPQSFTVDRDQGIVGLRLLHSFTDLGQFNSINTKKENPVCSKMPAIISDQFRILNAENFVKNITGCEYY